MVLRRKKEGEAGGKILRRKKKPEDETKNNNNNNKTDDEEDGAMVKNKKKKKNVAEIDGVLYALDENGNPTKKLRKKKKPGEEDGEDGKKPIRRGKSDSALNERRRPPVQAGQKIRRRAKSLGRDQAEAAERPKPPRRSMSAPGKARTYIDPKGRKVVIDEGGNKTVFDKNGKRLRKKGEKDAKEKPKSMSSNLSSDESADDFLSDLNADSKRESNIFDSLWDDGEKNNTGTADLGANGSNNNNNNAAQESELSQSLSVKISEVGKENKELQLKLSVAEEAIENLTEQNKKEKSKNVKAMTEVMQLKADFTEASSELQKLRSKVKDMQQTMDEKDKQISDLRGVGANGAEEKKSGPCLSCKQLTKEKNELEEAMKLDKEKYETEVKKKDERINFLSIELKTIKQELEVMINGDKGGPSNPTMVRLLQEKKSLETKYNQEKEVTTIRIEGMQEMIESLEKVNADLKRQLTGGTGGVGNDDGSDDGSLDMNYLAGGGGGNHDSGRNKKAAAGKKPASNDLNASISDMFSNLMSRK